LASSRVRYKVVTLTVLLAMVTYLDRVMRDLDLSKIQMGYVFSSFTLAYALFEIPTAWYGSWSFPIYLLGVMFLIGAVCRLIIDPQRPVFESPDYPDTGRVASAAAAGGVAP
jgi:hypothetical protein